MSFGANRRKTGGNAVSPEEAGRHPGSGVSPAIRSRAQAQYQKLEADGL